MTNMEGFSLFMLAAASSVGKFLLCLPMAHFFQIEGFLRQGLVKKVKLINTEDVTRLIVAQDCF